jgi:hypothetical protein
MDLEIKGWKFGGVEGFLGLTDEDVEYIELKIALSEISLRSSWRNCLNRNISR